MSPGKFHCGISGLVLPVPNKQAFPEAYRAGTRLTYYASLFKTIEVNSSFYKIPRAATFARWAGEVPRDFRFTIKLWRGITHEPGLTFAPANISRFMQAAAGIGHNKGCLLIQLPPGAKVDKAAQLQQLLENITSAAPDPWTLAVEFRDKSWYCGHIENLLKRFNASCVLQDIPKSRIWEPMNNTSTIYMRYHGPAGDYKGGYTEQRLKQDAEKIKVWLIQGKEVYVYFNNTIGDALANAQFLIEQMKPAQEPYPGHGATTSKTYP